MLELADKTDLESVANSVWVQVPLPTPYIVPSPSGKASDFDSDIHWFESSRDSQMAHWSSGQDTALSRR